MKATEQIFSKIYQRDILVFDLNRIVKETFEFNPTIVLKKSSFKIDPFVQIHRYLAGNRSDIFFE